MFYIFYYLLLYYFDNCKLQSLALFYIEIQIYLSTPLLHVQMCFDILPYVFVTYLPMFPEINLIQLLYKKIVLIFELFLCFVPYCMKGYMGYMDNLEEVDNYNMDNLEEVNNLIEVDNLVADIVLDIVIMMPSVVNMG